MLNVTVAQVQVDLRGGSVVAQVTILAQTADQLFETIGAWESVATDTTSLTKSLDVPVLAFEHPRTYIHHGPSPPPPLPSPSAQPSPPSASGTGEQATLSGEAGGLGVMTIALIGGGGAVALMALIAALLCWRWLAKRRTARRPREFSPRYSPNVTSGTSSAPGGVHMSAIASVSAQPGGVVLHELVGPEVEKAPPAMRSASSPRNSRTQGVDYI